MPIHDSERRRCRVGTASRRVMKQASKRLHGNYIEQGILEASVLYSRAWEMAVIRNCIIQSNTELAFTLSSPLDAEEQKKSP
jgi:hypothetical protein